MALDAGQTAYVDGFLGADNWDSTDIESRLFRTGSLALAVREVVAARRATLADQPASLSVPGEISINTTANLKALDDLLALLPQPPAPEPDGSAGLPTGGSFAGRLVRPGSR